MDTEFFSSLADNLLAMGALLLINGCFCPMNVFWVMIFTTIFIGILFLSIQGFFCEGVSSCILCTGVVLVVGLIGFSFQLRPQLEGIAVASDCLRWWCIGFFIAGAVVKIIPSLIELALFGGMLVLFIEGCLIGFLTTIHNPFINEDFFWCTKGLRCFAAAGFGILCIYIGTTRYDGSLDDDEANANEDPLPECASPQLVNAEVKTEQVILETGAEQITVEVNVGQVPSEADAEQITPEAIEVYERVMRAIRIVRWSITLFGIILVFWAVVGILQHLGIW